MLRRLSGSGWHGIGKMWPEGIRALPACGCIFGCIVACRVGQFSPNSTTYRAKLLSPHNRDVGLHIFKTGGGHLRCQWCVRLAHASAKSFQRFALCLTLRPNEPVPPELRVGCIDPRKPSLQPLRPPEPTSRKRSWLLTGLRGGGWPGSSYPARRADTGS